MHTTMRSQDLWLGFCYDLFTATLLQELLAGWLEVPVGEYHHHVDSLHLYDDVVDAATSLPDPVEPSTAIPAPATSWEDLDAVLAQVVTGQRPDQPAWAQYAAVMRSYRMWKAGGRHQARQVAAQASGSLARALDRWYDHLEARSTSAVAGSRR
jgi:thymidylate synthase